LKVGFKILWCLTLVLLPLCAACAAEPQAMRWTVAGIERQALVFPPSVPPSDTVTGKTPVIFFFHGHGSNMRAASHMGFQRLWPAALVVYMQGLPTPLRADPRGAWSGWQTEPGQFGDRDLKFFDQVLQTLKGKYSVDESRIYAAGFSNGAFFTYLLWAERAKTFAAFAPCAAWLFPAVHLTVPKPLLHIAGRRDRIVRFEEQEQTIEVARQVNGATAPGEPCGPGCELYPSTQGAPVEVRIHPAGHLVPPGAPRWIATFFKQHALPPGG
jgi:polyhydroxybutyrate depolymerase